jgi:hypothetical protein
MLSPVYFHLFFLNDSRILRSTARLLLTATLKQAARLGVEELVAINVRYQPTFSLSSLPRAPAVQYKGYQSYRSTAQFMVA